MIRSDYPDISDEQTTIRFILEGIENHPDWTTFNQMISNHTDLNPSHKFSINQLISMMSKHDDITKRTATPPLFQTTLPKNSQNETDL